MIGILEDSIDGTLRAMPIEIIVKENKDGHRILDYNVKKNDEEKVIPVTDIKIFKNKRDYSYSTSRYLM